MTLNGKVPLVFFLIEKRTFEEKKLEKDKFDEVDRSSAASGTVNDESEKQRVIAHLPTLTDFVPVPTLKLDHRRNHFENKVNSNRHDNSQSNRSQLKWKLERFRNENAPIILLGYKNRKWRNCNNVATIEATTEKDLYRVHLVRDQFSDFFEKESLEKFNWATCSYSLLDTIDSRNEIR